MMQRLAIAAIVVAAATVALWHPATAPGLAVVPAASGSPLAGRERTRSKPRMALGAALVYVVGAVTKPGLYRVAPNARVVDAVVAAGGLTSAADPAGVDLAAFVRDGDEVVVPRSGEPAPRRARVRRNAPARGHTAPAVALDVNAAAAFELAAVPGVGRALASRIVEMRERNGPFASLDELLDVAGMTQTRLERARPYLQI